jgi:hypothetical protein
MYVLEINRRFSSLYRRGPCSKLQILSVSIYVRSIYRERQYALRAPCLPLLEVYQICDTASVSLSYALSYEHRSRKILVVLALVCCRTSITYVNIAVKFQVGAVHERKP